jgi:hypothetical protein
MELSPESHHPRIHGRSVTPPQSQPRTHETTAMEQQKPEAPAPTSWAHCDIATDVLRRHLTIACYWAIYYIWNDQWNICY